MFARKRMKHLVSSEGVIGGQGKSSLPKYLGYALPCDELDGKSRVHQYDDLELHDVPLMAQTSFPDFEGVILFGGAFEEHGQDSFIGEPVATCAAPSDLDLRDREFYTAVQKGKTVVFLVPNLPTTLGYHSVDPRVDLFRRVMNTHGIHWDVLRSPIAHVRSDIPEFQEFIERFGTVHHCYSLRGDLTKQLCGGRGMVFAFTIADRVFVLPCAYPQTHQQAVEMAVTAVRAARDYRERIKETFPEWVAEYRFGKEGQLIAKGEELRGQLLTLESEIDVYKQYKGALCFRSDPLVRVVTEVLHDFFGIELEIDEKYIEDATLKDDNGNILAVFEIKGVNGDFKREDVNQVDSHRERAGLGSQTPGILIMNTRMSAKSLADKDNPPHPDIIKKAVADNVLLVRTLDLLRCADLCQAGKLPKEQFRATILTQAGWLKCHGETAEVAKQ